MVSGAVGGECAANSTQELLSSTPYKIQVMQELQERDLINRTNFCREFPTLLGLMKLISPDLRTSKISATRRM
jgi:hypothetical protein